MSTDFKPRTCGAFQFRLRTMLWSITFLGAACAVVHSIDPVWSAVCGFILLLASAHVLGNAVGTRLNAEGANGDSAADERPTFPPAVVGPKLPKRLAQRSPLGRWIGALTAGGLVAGGTLGGLMFSNHATLAAVLLGIFSSALLGGFATFLAASFLRVGLSALWQAHSRI